MAWESLALSTPKARSDHGHSLDLFVHDGDFFVAFLPQLRKLLLLLVESEVGEMHTYGGAVLEGRLAVGMD